MTSVTKLWYELELLLVKILQLMNVTCDSSIVKPSISSECVNRITLVWSNLCRLRLAKPYRIRLTVFVKTKCSRIVCDVCSQNLSTKFINHIAIKMTLAIAHISLLWRELKSAMIIFSNSNFIWAHFFSQRLIDSLTLINHASGLIKCYLYIIWYCICTLII